MLHGLFRPDASVCRRGLAVLYCLHLRLLYLLLLGSCEPVSSCDGLLLVAAAADMVTLHPQAPRCPKQLGSSFTSCSLLPKLQDIDEDRGIEAVQEAFRLGINLFDTSPFYGGTKSEAVLGRGIEKLPRDQIVVSSKVGRCGRLLPTVDDAGSLHYHASAVLSALSLRSARF